MNVRKEIERDVCAANIVLKEEVGKMDLIQLLRNCHPLYRSDYAHRLYRDDQLTKEQAREFTKVL